ncbi:MAG: phosphatase PAP2 family protein, partial [Planctomycetaceae bacterium]|nr:phosphatase PAP2 family protein [Planctomycetaceae bacterium]
LHTNRQLRALTGTLAMATGVAGVCFLVFPAELAYPVSTSQGTWPQFFQFADDLNLTYNLLPSLHVAYSVICASAYSRHMLGVWNGAVWLWAFTIALSTLLTHQHHLADVITGWFLGIVVTRMIYDSLMGIPATKVQQLTVPRENL